MIIFDGEFRKIDVKRSKDGWVQITSFGSRDGIEWDAKVVRLDSVTANGLAAFIVQEPSLNERS